MAKIFKPRRALRSSVKSGSKRTLVLASGELMLVGKTAIGEGSKADLYMGDGVSQMQNLSPAIYGDTSEEDITITDDTSTTASAALGNVTTGKTLGAILGSLKKAISLNAAAITMLNDDLKTFATTEVSLTNTWKNGTTSNNTARIWKIGNCVSFNYDFCINVDSNERVQIATLEEKYSMPFLVTYYQPIATTTNTESPYLQILTTTVWCRSRSTTVRIMGFVTWASNR